MQLLHDIQDEPPDWEKTFTKAVAKIDENGDGLVSFLDFTHLSQEFPLVLYPAFRMQELMQRQVRIGEEAWYIVFVHTCTRARWTMDGFTTQPTTSNPQFLTPSS